MCHALDTRCKSFVEQERSEGKHLIYVGEKHVRHDVRRPHLRMSNLTLIEMILLFSLNKSASVSRRQDSVFLYFGFLYSFDDNGTKLLLKYRRRSKYAAPKRATLA